MRPARVAVVVGATVLAMTVLPAGATVGGTSTPQISQPDAPPIEWGACLDREGRPVSPSQEVDCARYPVPLDYANPDEGTVELTLVRHAAEDPAARKGTLFVHDGVLDLVADPVYRRTSLVSPALSVLIGGRRLFDEDVRASFDIVGFDPRGTAMSDPLRCFDGTEDPERYTTPFLWPESGFERLDLKWTVDRYARRCDRRGGDIADHMSTTDTARDLEQLRKAVGDETLNFVGYAYGSIIAAYYVSLFPDQAGAVVVDGVYDPVAWATGRDGEGRTVPLMARLGIDVGTQTALDEFFRLCDEAGPEECALAPDSAERIYTLVEELDRRPLVLDFPHEVVDGQEFLAILRRNLYSSSGWDYLARRLAGYEYMAASRDDTTTGMAGTQQGERLDDAPASLAAEPVTLDTEPVVGLPIDYSGLEGFLGIVCSDADNPDHFYRWRRAAEESVGTFGPLWAWSDAGCSSWRGEDVDRYTGPFTAETETPVLIANPTVDPVTPYDGALALHELLPNSRLLTVEGWGHTTRSSTYGPPGMSQCAVEIVHHYLLTREVPTEDVTCQQDYDPFPDR